MEPYIFTNSRNKNDRYINILGVDALLERGPF
jgi:hypothetical protein